MQAVSGSRKERKNVFDTSTGFQPVWGGERETNERENKQRGERMAAGENRRAEIV